MPVVQWTATLFLLAPAIAANAQEPRIAVVPTGQFSRIHEGLALLDSDQVEMLFITGVNRGAGIQPSGFAEQFDLSPHLSLALAEGRILLATEAQSTLDNAREAACWLRTAPSGPVILVTSDWHMPRAMRALRRAVGKERAIFTHPVQDEREVTFEEWLKRLLSWLVTALPPALWPGDVPCPPPDFSLKP